MEEEASVEEQADAQEEAETNSLSAGQWLAKRVPGFAELPDDEKNSITDFCLLWGLFEARCLGNNASVRAFERVIPALLPQTDDRFEEIDRSLKYFQERYVSEDREFTHHFDHLLLRRPDQPQKVKSVLKGEVDDPASVLVVLLTIVYRYRNNLFHGYKWAYGVRDQRLCPGRWCSWRWSSAVFR